MIIQPSERLKLVDEYYFSKKLEEIEKMRASGIDVINLGIGSPDMAPSQQTIDAAVEALKVETSHAYATSRSMLELREGMAAFYKGTYNVSLDSKTEVLPLLGSKEGVMYASMAFLNPGDEVLVPNPGYPAYAACAKLIGAKVQYYDLTEDQDWQPDFEKLKKQDLSKVKMMWTNYPHMPTGQPASSALYKAFVEFAKAKKILICNDNPYSLVLNPEPLSILEFDAKKEVCVELNSLSKSFNMAGWRVGMVVGKREYIDAILQVKSNVDSGMFSVVQKGAAEALKNTQAWHDERNSVYAERRQTAYEILDELGCKYQKDKVGMFVWAKAPDKVKNTAEFLDTVLQKSHVFITPGFIFGSNGERFVRISLCSPKEVLSEALKRVKAGKWRAGA